MILELGILFLGIILHSFWFFGIISSKVLVPLIDSLLITIILFYYFPRKKKNKTTPVKKPNFPYPAIFAHHENFFIIHWKKKYFANDRGKLPLDRIAYLKARYKVGPFMRYRYSNELTVPFFKKIAQGTIEGNCNDDAMLDDIHPRIFLTEFTEKYVQYRALLYYAQQTPNVDTKYQITCLKDSDEAINPQVQQDIFASSRTGSTVPASILDDRFRIASDIASGFEETEESARKKMEFEEQIEASKKKLEDVQGVFHIIKQGKTLNHTIRDERAPSINNNTKESNLHKFFPFFCERKKKEEDSEK
ncbi:uncharacterized protein CDAR_409201 [Caerostris darwini]|uniref:Ycf1 n=1 Tax=Caerostris darwini TaxID=1538125 RepID=A0AAV4PBY6_9ARAC|nr:uncharacterized protein CDAR_409201 [Caerostris darwini]